MTDKHFVIRNERGEYLAPCESFIDHLMGSTYWVKDKSEALRFGMGHAESFIVNQFGRIPGNGLMVEPFEVDPWELLRELYEESETSVTRHHNTWRKVNEALKQHDAERKSDGK